MTSMHGIPWARSCYCLHVTKRSPKIFCLEKNMLEVSALTTSLPATLLVTARLKEAHFKSNRGEVFESQYALTEAEENLLSNR